MAEAMILGLSWLTKWSPIVHWGKKKHIVSVGKVPNPPRRKWSEPEHQRNKGEGLEHTKVASKLALEMQNIPREYWDLAEVFSEKECDVLPHPPTLSHGLCNCGLARGKTPQIQNVFNYSKRDGGVETLY